MKYKIFLMFIFVSAMAFLNIAQAEAVYAVNKPTYIPTAISPTASISAPGDYTMTTQGLSTVSLRVTGTCTSLAGTVQGSNDNTNWSDLTIYPVSGGSPAKSFAAAGFWKFNAAGLRKVRAHVTALSAACSFAMAGTTASGDLTASDPCQDPSQLKSSVAVDQGASATTKVVEAATGKKIYVCGLSASAVGTNPTMTFLYGTKTTTDCDTGAANLTGAMIPAAADGMVNMGAGQTVMAAPASNQLCLTTGATTSIQGVLTYVQTN